MDLNHRPHGVVTGTTQAAVISVAGQLIDSIYASGKLSIGSTGQVSGDVSYSTLEVAKGGEIFGVIKRF